MAARHGVHRRRRGAHSARSSPLRPCPACPQSSAPVAPRTALRRSVNNVGATSELHDHAARRVALRRSACAPRSSLPYPPAPSHKHSAPAAPHTARCDTPSTSVRVQSLMAACCDVRRGGVALVLRAAARRTRAPPTRKRACPLRNAQRSAAPSTTWARLRNFMNTRRDVQHGDAARTARAAARRTRAPHVRTTPARPLRRVQRTSAAPLMPGRLQDIMKARRDVRRGGAALVLRAAARCALRPAMCRGAPPPAAPHAARRVTAKHVSASPGPHGSETRRAALQLNTRTERSSPPRPRPARPLSSAPAAACTARHRCATHADVTP
jgi:hypothetical protein